MHNRRGVLCIAPEEEVSVPPPSVKALPAEVLKTVSGSRDEEYTAREGTVSTKTTPSLSRTTTTVNKLK